MTRTSYTAVVSVGALLLLTSCANRKVAHPPEGPTPPKSLSIPAPGGAELLHDKGLYLTVPLTTDLSVLLPQEHKVLQILMEAAAIVDRIFMIQSGGDPYRQLAIEQQLEDRWLANYGPWDRLQDNQPFIYGVGPKPAGAGFYPEEMTKSEFERWNDPIGKSPYSMISRESNGALKATWYHQAFAQDVQRVSNLLEEAARTTTDEEFSRYLIERARAVKTDVYGASDVSWLKMKNNQLDLIIGPIENYEDKLLGLKTSYEAYVLVKDPEWTKRIDHIAGLLPKLQTVLPGPEDVHNQPVGDQSQLAVYDVVYYAGECNSGSKTIAVNLPNDEQVQQDYGTRRSQLKNAMEAKYTHILHPIASRFIAKDQMANVTFDAFFANVMFHEVAHGLGPKQTSDGGSVREALKDQYSWLEEEKADVLGLWLIEKLIERGELKGEMRDHYVTFVAGIFRSCRFGSASAHGVANMHTFNFMLEKKAVELQPDGTYFVHFDRMRSAINDLAARIITWQFNGDYNALGDQRRSAQLNPEIIRSLQELTRDGIPVDLQFEQGWNILNQGKN